MNVEKNKVDVSNSTNNLKWKKKSTIKNKVGDFVEKVGHKISEAGAPVLGQKIHDLGDNLEDDHDNADHPHRVKCVFSRRQ